MRSPQHRKLRFYSAHHRIKRTSTPQIHMSPSYSNSVLWGKRSCILSCIATLDSYRFLPFFSLEWVNNLLHKAFGTQLIILAFVAVLPVVVLYTQAMGSKEWKEVNAFLCIYIVASTVVPCICSLETMSIYCRTMLNLGHCLSIVWKNRMHQRQPKSRFCQDFHHQLFLWRNAKAEIWSVSLFSEQELLNCYLISGMFYLVSYHKMVRRYLSHFSCANWNYLLSLLQDEYHLRAFILHACI